jgi:hypothetical protein
VSILEPMCFYSAAHATRVFRRGCCKFRNKALLVIIPKPLLPKVGWFCDTKECNNAGSRALTQLGSTKLMRLWFWSDSQRQYLRHQSKSGTSPPSLIILDSAQRTIEIITATMWRCSLWRSEGKHVSQTHCLNGTRQTLWQITSFYIWLFAVDVKKGEGAPSYGFYYGSNCITRPNRGARGADEEEEDE